MVDPSKGTETDDEIDHHFSGMTSSGCKGTKNWLECIIDSSASNHMTPDSANLFDLVPAYNSLKINFPIGDTAAITHTGKAKLGNGLILEKVMCVLKFKHNLLSVQKFIQDSHCEVRFLTTYCIIVDCETKAVRGVGKVINGLYYLVTNTDASNTCLAANTSMSHETQTPNKLHNPQAMELWHHRLGYAPLSKLKYIPQILQFIKQQARVCVTCPLTKFQKLPFSLSNSRQTLHLT